MLNRQRRLWTGYSQASRLVGMLNNPFTETGDVLKRRALDTFRSLTQSIEFTITDRAIILAQAILVQVPEST